jgi:hypothetical protein
MSLPGRIVRLTGRIYLAHILVGWPVWCVTRYELLRRVLEYDSNSMTAFSVALERMSLSGLDTVGYWDNKNMGLHCRLCLSSKVLSVCVVTVVVSCGPVLVSGRPKKHISTPPYRVKK